MQINERYPGNEDKVRKMAILYDGQVKMANMAIVAGYSVNGVAKLHTEILKNQELHDFYEMFPEKFNNKTNGITQRRFLSTPCRLGNKKGRSRLDYRSYNAFKAQGLCGQPCCTAGVC